MRARSEEEREEEAAAKIMVGFLSAGRGLVVR
jgi:hypothetical protein